MAHIMAVLTDMRKQFQEGHDKLVASATQKLQAQEELRTGQVQTCARLGHVEDHVSTLSTRVTSLEARGVAQVREEAQRVAAECVRQLRAEEATVLSQPLGVIDIHRKVVIIQGFARDAARAELEAIAARLPVLQGHWRPGKWWASYLRGWEIRTE